MSHLSCFQKKYEIAIKKEGGEEHIDEKKLIFVVERGGTLGHFLTKNTPKGLNGKSTVHPK